MNNNVKDTHNQRTSLCVYCNQKVTQTHYCISSKKGSPSGSAMQASSLQEAVSLSNDPDINPPVELVEVPRIIKPWVNLRNHVIGKEPAQQNRICVVSPQRYDVIDKIQLSFIEQLSIKELPMAVQLYHGYGDRDFLNQRLIPHLSNQSFNVLCTVGLESTKTALHIFGEKRKMQSIPGLFFTGVRDLSYINIDSLNHEYITGVEAMRLSEPQFEALIALMPDMRRLVIAYCPDECGGTTTRIKNEMVFLFEGRGVVVDCVPVRGSLDIARTVEPFLFGADLLLTLRDNTVTPLIPILAELSRKWKVPLCGSDWEVVNKGAALGFGADEAKAGGQLADQAYAFLKERVPVNDIPLDVFRSEHSIKINLREAALQGFEVDAARLSAVKKFLIS